ncbi:Alpha-glucosidase [Verticillium dahliae VDG1]|nr:Alpha-glucosidase [Verticillium dahliae VDG1]
MAEKDLLPTRLRLTWRLAREFVKEYFEQNPISQMGIVGMRDGVAAINKWAEIDPQGSPSLQNALEMCRGALL